MQQHTLRQLIEVAVEVMLLKLMLMQQHTLRHDMYCYPLCCGRALDIKVGPLKRECIPLSTGVTMEVLSQLPSRRSDARTKHLPPLLFVHGSYHGAWCWAEHWMPFLAGKGYDTYSVSLRGTSGTPAPTPADGQVCVCLLRMILIEYVH
jgi:hypothetical protein